MYVQKVFPKSELESKKRPETAITQFKNSLNKLIEILISKEPSYIRCLKPNDLKKSGNVLIILSLILKALKILICVISFM